MAADLKSEVKAALTWRAALQVRDSGAARAARARLRRAASPLDAFLVEETHDLIRAVRQAASRKLPADFDRRLVALAMTLPRLEGQSEVPFAAALGRTTAGRAPSGEERPRLLPARFGALIRTARAREWDAFVRALRRALAILGEAPIDVAAFTRDILALDDATLRGWTYAYWQTLQPRDADASDAEEREDAA